YYEKIVSSLEFTLELEETEQHQSYQELIQILIEEESTSQELIKAIKEIQQNSEERFKQTLELAKKIALKKAKIYRESAKEIYESISIQLSIQSRSNLIRRKKDQQQSYQNLINKISRTDKPKKEHEKYLITEIKSSENRKEQIIELVKYFFHQASKKTFEESIDKLKETVLDQLKERESFEESITFDRNHLKTNTEAIKLKWTIGYQDTTDQIAKQVSEAKIYHDWSKIIEDKLIDNYDYIPIEYKSRKIYYYELISLIPTLVEIYNPEKVELKERSTREKEKLPRKKSEPTYSNCIICNEFRRVNQVEKICKSCKITINKKETERRNQEFLESVKLRQETIQNCEYCLERHKECIKKIEKQIFDLDAIAVQELNCTQRNENCETIPKKKGKTRNREKQILERKRKPKERKFEKSEKQDHTSLRKSCDNCHIRKKKCQKSLTDKQCHYCKKEEKDYFQSQIITEESLKEKLNKNLKDLPTGILRQLVCNLFYTVLERESKQLTKVVEEIDKQTEPTELQTAVEEIGQFKYFLTQPKLRIDYIRANIGLGRITILENLNSSITEQKECLKEIIKTYEDIKEQQKDKLKQLLKELFLIIRKKSTFNSLTRGLAEVSTKIKKTIQQLNQ
ncbi:10222_t:CDS:2, partial [Cetraspora pellucida]